MNDKDKFAVCFGCLDSKEIHVVDTMMQKSIKVPCPACCKGGFKKNFADLTLKVATQELELDRLRAEVEELKADNTKKQRTIDFWYRNRNPNTTDEEYAEAIEFRGHQHHRAQQRGKGEDE